MNPQSPRSSFYHRRRNLRVEFLEARRVLTSITGSVINDLNGNGAIDQDEPGQALVSVYVDANANDLLDIVGDTIEPDDYADGETISVPGVTLSVVDRANQIRADRGPVRAIDDALDLTGTGDKIFGYANRDVSFVDSLRLRADFDDPVSSVQAIFIGRSPTIGDTGILNAYDTNDNLIDSYRTAALKNGAIEMMTVQSTGDIAYIVAFTENVGLTGRVDSLRINGLNSELWTLTASDGSYTLPVGDGGTYRVNEVVPDGFLQTLPNGDGSRTVPVADGATAEGINFANTEAINQAPIAVDDSATTAEDTAITIDVIANDTDDGTIDRGTVMTVDDPANGQATVLNSGEIAYTPNLDFHGNDSLTYTVQDDAGLVSNIGTVSIEVTPVNDAPVAADDSGSTTGGTVAIEILDNDVDVDGILDQRSLRIGRAPANGTATVDTILGVIQYTPNENFSGVDTLTYFISDEEGQESNEATVSITVSDSGRSWHNAANPLDVNNDGFIEPLDVIIVINELNNPQYRDPETNVLPPPPDPVPFFYDVDDDGQVIPLDVILIINFLNTNSPPVRSAL